MDHDQYEQECERITQDNAKLLEQFKKWLTKQQLSAKTIKKHIDNVEFFINDYLLYDDTVEAHDGISSVGSFLGYWFIRKAAWATQSSIKDNAASLKKFYQFMCEQHLVTKDALLDLYQTIKEDMDEWLATLARYDDPSIEDRNDVWGF